MRGPRRGWRGRQVPSQLGLIGQMRHTDLILSAKTIGFILGNYMIKYMFELSEKQIGRGDKWKYRETIRKCLC